MGSFKVTRKRIGKITFDFNKPCINPNEYQKINRMSNTKQIEYLIKNGYIHLDKQLKETKIKEDLLIQALKSVGGIFVPEIPKKRKTIKL